MRPGKVGLMWTAVNGACCNERSHATSRQLLFVSNETDTDNQQYLKSLGGGRQFDQQPNPANMLNSIFVSTIFRVLGSACLVLCGAVDFSYI